MKKITSILLILSLIFVFSSCGGEKNESDVSSVPSVVLKTDVSEVSPGEEIEIILNVKNIKYFASGDITVAVSDEAVLSDKKSIPFGELHMESSMLSGVFNLGAYVATTIDLPDNDLYVLTYRVNDDAEIGSVIEFTPGIRSFSIGTDETGNETKSIIDDVSLSAVSVTVN